MNHWVARTILAATTVSVPGVLLAEVATPRAGVTLQAFQMRQAAHILSADTDQDGRISLAEFLAYPKGKPTAARFAKLDKDGDGFLTRDEIDARSAERFVKLDRNGDGIVTPVERHPNRAVGGTPDTSGK